MCECLRCTAEHGAGIKQTWVYSMQQMPLGCRREPKDGACSLRHC